MTKKENDDASPLSDYNMNEGAGNNILDFDDEVSNEFRNPFRIFSDDRFGEIRTTTIESRPYFGATDVATALGYSNPKDAILRHCKGVTKREVLTSGGAQLLNYIPESDLYRLIAHSKLPAAEEFEAWIFEEVLPSIAHQGGYVAPEVREAFSIGDELSKAQSKPQIMETLFAAPDIKVRLEQLCLIEQKKTLVPVYSALVGKGFAYKDKFGYPPTAWANNTGLAKEIIKSTNIMNGVDYSRTTIGLTERGVTRLCKEMLKDSAPCQAELVSGKVKA